MTTKFTDYVRHDGQITTINELDKQGLIEYEVCDNFYSSRTASGKTTKHFANIKGTTLGWEISKTNYLVRTGQKDKIMKPEKLITADNLEITNDAIKAFNNKILLLANDNWNKSKNHGTLEENRFLRLVARYYGSIEKLNTEDIKRYIEKK